MAVPKQKSSKGRTRRRRSHHGLSSAALVKCSHCGKPASPHQVCPNCGYYKNREVVDVLKNLDKPKRRK